MELLSHYHILFPKRTVLLVSCDYMLQRELGSRWRCGAYVKMTLEEDLKLYYILQERKQLLGI